MKRKQHSAQFKAKVALEATKGRKAANQLASECGVQPTQISKWMRRLQEGIQEEKIFSSEGQKQEKEEEELKATLYQEIGQFGNRPVQGRGDWRPSLRPGLEHRHHLRADAALVYLPGGGI